jgi:hypothetical protein
MNADSVTRGHVFKLGYLQLTVVLMLGNVFFSQRIVIVWNSLPASAVNFASLATFKTFITKTDLSTYLQCNV